MMKRCQCPEPKIVLAPRQIEAHAPLMPEGLALLRQASAKLGLLHGLTRASSR